MDPANDPFRSHWMVYRMLADGIEPAAVLGGGPATASEFKAEIPEEPFALANGDVLEAEVEERQCSRCLRFGTAFFVSVSKTPRGAFVGNAVFANGLCLSVSSKFKDSPFVLDAVFADEAVNIEQHRHEKNCLLEADSFFILLALHHALRETAYSVVEFAALRLPRLFHAPLELVTEAGFSLPSWSRDTHARFPPFFRRRVFVILCVIVRLLGSTKLVPFDLLEMIFEYERTFFIRLLSLVAHFVLNTGMARTRWNKNDSRLICSPIPLPE